MSLSLDAREILIHLNEMGYRNITAEQLKEFMRGCILFYFLRFLITNARKIFQI